MPPVALLVAFNLEDVTSEVDALSYVPPEDLPAESVDRPTLPESGQEWLPYIVRGQSYVHVLNPH